MSTRLRDLLVFACVVITAVTACGDNFDTQIEVDDSYLELPIGVERTLRYDLPGVDGARSFINRNPEIIEVIEVTGGIEIRGIAVGTAVIEIREATVRMLITVVITAAQIEALEVEPAQLTVPASMAAPIRAYALYNDGSRLEVTNAASWVSSAPSIANYQAGSVRGLAAGSATITATYQGLSDSSAVTVTGVTLIRLEITPPLIVVPVGATQRFIATGVFSDNSSRDVSSQVVWTSSNLLAATISETGVVTAQAAAVVTVQATLSGLSATATAVVTSTNLVSITIDAPSTTLPIGAKMQLTATGHYGDGSSHDLTTQVTWTDPAGKASVSNGADRGMATGVMVGTATIAATLGAVSGQKSIEITGATVSRIELSEVALVLPVGVTHQVHAIAIYSDNTSLDVTGQAVWTSGSPGIASVEGGLVRGVATGITGITATHGGQSATVGAVVLPAILQLLEVSPLTATIPINTTRQFIVIARFSDGLSLDVTNQALWNSDAPLVASVSNAVETAGLVTAHLPGVAHISTAFGGLIQQATLTVVEETLTSIEISPTQLALAVNTTGALHATGVYSNGTTRDITEEVSWQSANTGVATVSNAQDAHGEVTAVATGTASVTAQIGSLVASANVTVTGASLLSISIDGVGVSMPLGTSAQLTATGHYNDGSTQNLTGLATWSSNSPAVTVSNGADRGRATAAEIGSAVISAVYGGRTGTLPIVVAPVLISRIELSEVLLALPSGTQRQITATAVYDDNTTQDVTQTATWSSSGPSATVDRGLVRAVSPGAAVITASKDGMSAVLAVTVTPATINSLEIQPPTLSIPDGTSGQLIAIAHFSDNTSLDVTLLATWSTDAASIATVSNLFRGRVTGEAPGIANITAALAGQTATIPVTVTSATLQSIEISPLLLTLSAGTTTQMRATGLYTDGSTRDLSAEVSWTSSAEPVATVSSAGLVTGRSVGLVTITATSGAVTSAVLGAVTPSSLLAITIEPLISVLPIGSSSQLTATGHYSDGTTQNLTSQVTWSADPSGNVTVSNAADRGKLTAVGVGLASVTATLGSTIAVMPIIVTPATLARIEVSDLLVSLPAGTQRQVTATAVYNDNTTQDVTQTATWSSSGPSATVNKGLISAISTGAAIITVTKDGMSAVVAVTVTLATLDSITITPSTLTLPAGTTGQLIAMGHYSDNSSVDLTALATWLSDAPAVAAASNTVRGEVLGKTVGTANISASYTGRTGSAVLTISNATLQSIEVSPVTLTLSRGTTGTLRATGVYSDGSTREITGEVSWTSSAPTIASVGNSGAVSANATGSATITAATAGLSATASITVTPATLNSIVVDSPLTTLPIGAEVQLTATGHYSDGTTQNLTTQVTWSADPLGTVTVSNGVDKGTVKGVTVGPALVSATLGAASGTLAVLVTPALLSRIELSEILVVLPAGTQRQLTATAVYGDNTTQDVTQTATWTSATPDVTVTAGLLTAVSVGGSLVTASKDGMSAAAVVTVSLATLDSVTVAPTVVSLPNGTSRQLTATGHYSDNSTLDVTLLATWLSDAPAVASVSNLFRGQVTGQSLGTANVSATFGGRTASAAITVTAATLSSIGIAPSATTMARGTTTPLVATGLYSDGSTRTLTSEVGWTSSAPTVATVSSASGSQGVVTAVNAGLVTITATSGALTATSTIVVTAATLGSITIEVPQPSLPVGSTMQLAAIGHYSDGTTQDITAQTIWLADLSGHATVSNAVDRGRVRGISIGSATITATSGLMFGSATVNVTAATLSRIDLSDTTLTLPRGAQHQITATAVFSDDTTLDVTAAASWSSSSSTATVLAGQVSASEPGSATITASLNGVVGNTTVTITEAALQSITVAPPSPSVPLATTRALTATGHYSDGTTQDLTGQAAWATDAALVASVSNTDGSRGVVTGTLPGTAQISATLGAISGSSTVTVTVAIITHLQVTPSTLSLPAGSAHQLTATAVYSDNTSRDATADVSWSSSAPSIVGVSNTNGTRGRVTAIAQGNAVVTAQLGLFTAAANVGVTTASLDLITIEPAPIPAIARGLSTQLTALGTYSDNSVVNLTNQVTWSSDSSATASVSNSVGTRGRVTGNAAGDTAITATLGTVSAVAPVTVTAATLVSLATTPALMVLPKGTNQPFSVTGTYSDGSTANLTATASITSQSPAVATYANGAITGVDTGVTQIDVASGSVTTQATITVSPATLVTLNATPATMGVPAGLTAPLVLLGTFSDGSIVDLTSNASFVSDNPAVATVSNVVGSIGLVNAIAPGTANVTATVGGVTKTIPVTVSNAILSNVTVDVGTGSLLVAEVRTFSATAHYSDGTTLDVTNQAQWSSGNGTVVSVSNLPLLKGKGVAIGTGVADVNAVFAGVTGTSQVGVGAGCHVVVNEIRPAAFLAPSHEWVELYNPCTVRFDLTGRQLVYRDAGSASDILLVALSGELAPDGYLLYRGAGYSGPNDGSFTQNLGELGGGVAIRASAGGTIIDSVGYGVAPAVFIETVGAILGVVSQSIARVPNGSDTNNNLVDFALLAGPTPRARN